VDAYRAPQIRLRLQSLVLPGVKRIAICGHSLGAALAVLCAADMQAAFPDRQVEVILFGCPRVGNRNFCEHYNRVVPNTLRVENGNDIVTKVPPKIFGYRHVGAKIHVGHTRVPFLFSAKAHRPTKYYSSLYERFL
jgi:triacylglycerol lipase